MTEDLDHRGHDRTEDRLRRAIADHSAGVRPDEGAGLSSIEHRVRAAGRARRLRRTAIGVMSVAACLALVTAVPAILGDNDDGRVRTTGSDVTSTTIAPPPSTAPTTVPPEVVPAADAVWPPPGSVSFADPVAAARSFVEQYVGITNPPLSELRSTGTSTGEVDMYRRNEDGSVRDRGAVSTVSLRRTNGNWEVLSARTPDIVVDNPLPSGTVGSPVVVDGRGRGYEGTIVVSVRDRTMGDGRSLAQKPTIAGCCEELKPFHVELALTAPSGTTGSLLLTTGSGLEAVSSFAVVPIRFGPTPQVGDEATVEVFWVDPAGQLVSAPRTVRRSAGVLHGALEQLLFGPYSVERDAGLRSALPNEAAAAAVSVVIRDGLAVVDFGADLPATSRATSSSAASEQFLRQLQATVLQFPTVTTAEYRVGGSCQAFWEWLQRACTTVNRTKSGI